MTEHEPCLILVYSKRNNKYTAHVLTAAIEAYAKFAALYLIPMESINFEELVMLRNKCKKIVIGMTFATPQLGVILDMVPMFKRALPSAILVAGGPHATGDPYGTLTRLGFDLVVYGEGEKTLIELLEAIRDNKELSVCGTACLEEEKLVIKVRRPINLDDYPPFPHWRNLFNPIEIMRGCSASCYFCQVTYMFGLPRYRSIDNILFYSRIMFEKKLRDLRFIAPNSFGYGSRDGVKPDTDRLLELLSRLRQLADMYGGRIFFGTFPSEVRPDSVTKDIAREVRRLVDNRRIIVGIQSGSNRILSMIHRGHTLEDSINAVRILVESGFQVDADFILGFGFEEEEDIAQTMNAIRILTSLGARIHLHTFIPLPGTPMFTAMFKPLKDDIKKQLAKLVGDKRAYGYWIEQEKIAKQIAGYRRAGLIYSVDEYRSRLKIVTC